MLDGTVCRDIEESTETMGTSIFEDRSHRSAWMVVEGKPSKRRIRTLVLILRTLCVICETLVFIIINGWYI